MMHNASFASHNDAHKDGNLRMGHAQLKTNKKLIKQYHPQSNFIGKRRMNTFSWVLGRIISLGSGEGTKGLHLDFIATDPATSYLILLQKGPQMCY